MTDLVMPKLGLTMEEGLVQEWVVQPGASFSRGDVLLVVETDKIANEVEAVSDGTLQEILVPAGETAACGVPIARWAESDATGDEGPAPKPVPEPAAASGSGSESVSPSASASGRESMVAPVSTAATAPSSTSTQVSADGGRIVATPFARKLALQLGVDLAGVTGTGPRGRIKGPDVQKAAAAGQAQAVSEAPPALANVVPLRSAPDASGAALPSPAPTSSETRREATRFEKVTADRMTSAKRVPHFYLSSEVNMAGLEALRKQLNALEGRPRVSVTHLLIAALARTLTDHPEANCVWDGGEVVQYAGIDIGVAVSTDNGLMAPVVRNLGSLRIHEIAQKCREVVERTRSGRLTPDDMGGGATSISNAGMHDVTYMGSIITPGQSSIFGIGSTRQVFRPDAEGKPVLEREMGIVMSCDHRIFDGVGGLKVLNRLKTYLENPLQIVV